MRKIRKTKVNIIDPKPPVLDIKGQNCDINVGEWENIPKFSKLDDVENPLRLFDCC